MSGCKHNSVRVEMNHKEELSETLASLEKYGLRPDHEFYVENVFNVRTYFEAVSTVTVSENDYESGNFDAWKHAEIMDKIHEEKTIVGFQLLDKDFKKTTFEDLTKDIKLSVPNGINNCKVCGTKVVRNTKLWGDVREMKDGLRCFDHIGVLMA